MIIDEISNGLDIETLQLLQEKLMILKQSCIIIATGHHFEFYENIVDNLLLIKSGKIVKIDEYKKGGLALHEIYKQHINVDQ